MNQRNRAKRQGCGRGLYRINFIREFDMHWDIRQIVAESTARLLRLRDEIGGELNAYSNWKYLFTKRWEH